MIDNEKENNCTDGTLSVCLLWRQESEHTIHQKYLIFGQIRQLMSLTFISYWDHCI